ncbi:methyltransferase domain-containing protein [Streptomyces sp. NPDC093109]|uniref:class I SAM-dependent methyltransferase n=1 Tax=Streptomyces sp. NPDC093109 TaxID=3154977 RepID=UPI00344E35CE
MTHITEQQSAAVSNRRLLAHTAYADERHLAARQSLYRWQRPQYDLPEIVVGELAYVKGTVLDIGCGNGTFVNRMRADRRDLRVVGIDISAGILAHVEKPAFVADAHALPFADGTADAVLALHMLYHMADIPAAVREMARVLRSSGLAVASTNSENDKRELDQLWQRAAADVLGIPEGPSRLSLSSRFSLEKAPAFLGAEFSDIRVRELPGTVEVTDPAPVVAHLASYEAWSEQCGVPFRETVARAHQLVSATIASEGSFTITCLGGFLICRA